MKHDLSTFLGWYNAGLELLQDKPFGTALKDHGGGVYYLVYDDELCAVPDNGPNAVYTEQDISAVEMWAWCDDAWDGMDAQECQKTLLEPEFIQLDFSKC